MPSRNRTVDLGMRGLRAGVGDHIAYFWETPDEFAEAVSFLEAGVRQGEHVVIFGHHEANARVLETLESRGVDSRRLQARRAMSVLGPEPDGELMLGRIGATFQEALDASAPMIRLLGNIGWGRAEWPDEIDILRFEAKVTAAAASFPCVVVCMYDINSLTGSVLMHGAFGTHPLTIHQNLVRENPMCMNVDEFLQQLERRRSA